MTITVVVADDQALIRAGFQALLDRTDGIDVVGVAADGDEALAVVRRTRPDVVLMDVRMPGVDGLEATRAISADPALAGVRVAVLTTYEIDEYVYAALRAGASGFLLKTITPDELRRAITVIAAGDALLAPSVTRRLITAFAATPGRDPAHADQLARLTEREREILALVARGHSNSEIAQRLYLSPTTVKSHVSHAITKLGVRDRAGLVVFAYESGFAAPPLA